MLQLITRIATKIIEKRPGESSKDNFYFNKIYFKRIAALAHAFNLQKEKGAVCATKEKIQPLNTDFFASYKEVLKLVGKPKYIYDNNHKEHNHKALVLRQSISNVSFIVQLHFYNNSLFFVGFDLSKNSRTEHEKVEIVNAIVEKYLNCSYNDGAELPTIEDPTGNFIIMNEDVNFSICYFANNLEEVKKNIIEATTGAKQPMNKKDKESLFYAF